MPPKGAPAYNTRRSREERDKKGDKPEDLQELRPPGLRAKIAPIDPGKKVLKDNPDTQDKGKQIAPDLQKGETSKA